MSRGQAVVLLTWRFLRALVASAWTTGRQILLAPAARHRGFARLPYGTLGERGVLLLSALVTLTPGSSVIEVDTGDGELLLHLLDATDAEATVAALRREFLEPVSALFGERP